mmetsp:Transcript_15271/g.58058  ORF Transcript_15271/g.58058 Transcript_15271/m.58058 type:complete len:271 (+) Transcript_15271:2263-3075(+)|eukprot:scaffold876_cov243-Pinguiococcus_pyrenoidosus.AAC.31
MQDRKKIRPLLAELHLRLQSVQRLDIPALEEPHLRRGVLVAALDVVHSAVVQRQQYPHVWRLLRVLRPAGIPRLVRRDEPSIRMPLDGGLPEAIHRNTAAGPGVVSPMGRGGLRRRGRALVPALRLRPREHLLLRHLVRDAVGGRVGRIQVLHVWRVLRHRDAADPLRLDPFKMRPYQLARVADRGVRPEFCLECFVDAHDAHSGRSRHGYPLLPRRVLRPSIATMAPQGKDGIVASRHVRIGYYVALQVAVAGRRPSGHDRRRRRREQH